MNLMDRTSDWAFLPQDLLQLVARKLTDICGHIRFRSVCSSWRLGIAVGPSDLVHPQIPWLILSTCTKLPVVKPSKGDRVYTPEIPNLSGMWIHSSSHGWLFMIGGSNPFQSPFSVTLLNPITNTQILLPPWLLDLLFKKAIVCPPLASPRPGQLLAVVLVSGEKLAFTRQGDEKWTMVESFPTGRALVDIVSVEDKVYVVDCDGRVAVLEHPSLEVGMLLHLCELPSRPSKFSLVEAAGDVLLFVWGSLYGLDLDIFRLDSTRKEGSNWVRQGIIDMTIFQRESMFADFSVCAQDLPDGRGYRIYFTRCSPAPSKIKVRVIDLASDEGITVQTNFEVSGEWWRALAWRTFWIIPHLH